MGLGTVAALIKAMTKKTDTELAQVKTDIHEIDDLLGIGDPVMQDTMPVGYKSANYSNAAGTNKYKWENDVLVLKKANGSFGEINSSNANLSIGETTTFIVDQSKSVYLDYTYENENDPGIAVIVIRYYADNYTDNSFVNLQIPVGTGTASIDLKQVAIANEIPSTRKNVFIRSIKLIEETGKTAKFAQVNISGFGVLVQPENRIDTIENDIDSIETDVNNLEGFNDAIRNPENLFEQLYEDLGYLNDDDGGIRNFNATYIERASKFIPVTAGEMIHYQAWASGDPHGRICYYNSSKAFVSYEDIPSENRTGNYAHLDKNVPTGISFIRFAYYGFGNGKACVTRENIPTGWIPAFVDIGSKVFNNADIYPIRGINHRGYSTVAPENTMPAFIMSKENGFDMVETDVQFTSDNVPVLLHDTTINRTARNADGTQLSSDVAINSITYAQSQEYDFGIWKDASYAGTKIPKFEDFIILCKQIGIHPYIELKNDIVYTDAQLLSLIDIVNKHDMMHLCTWKSFALSQLRVIKRNAPMARLGYLVSTITEKRVSEAQFLQTQCNEVFIDALVTNLTSELIALVKNAHVTLEAYGVNTEQAMIDLKDVLSGATSDEYNFPVVVKESILES